MKKLLLLAALASACVAHAQTTPAPAMPTPAPSPAQTQGQLPAPDQLAARQIQRLTQALALTPDQQPKVEQILLAQRQSMQAVRQQTQVGGGRRGAGRALLASRQQTDEQLRAVLTPEQFNKYQQLVAQRRQQMLERRQQNQMAGPLD